jgi:hypothetical protein
MPCMQDAAAALEELQREVQADRRSETPSTSECTTASPGAPLPRPGISSAFLAPSSYRSRGGTAFFVPFCPNLTHPSASQRLALSLRDTSHHYPYSRLQDRTSSKSPRQSQSAATATTSESLTAAAYRQAQLGSDHIPHGSRQQAAPSDSSSSTLRRRPLAWVLEAPTATRQGAHQAKPLQGPCKPLASSASSASRRSKQERLVAAPRNRMAEATRSCAVTSQDGSTTLLDTASSTDMVARRSGNFDEATLSDPNTELPQRRHGCLGVPSDATVPLARLSEAESKLGSGGNGGVAISTVAVMPRLENALRKIQQELASLDGEASREPKEEEKSARKASSASPGTLHEVLEVSVVPHSKPGEHAEAQDGLQPQIPRDGTCSAPVPVSRPADVNEPLRLSTQSVATPVASEGENLMKTQAQAGRNCEVSESHISVSHHGTTTQSPLDDRHPFSAAAEASEQGATDANKLTHSTATMPAPGRAANDTGSSDQTAQHSLEDSGTPAGRTAEASVHFHGLSPENSGMSAHPPPSEASSVQRSVTSWDSASVDLESLMGTLRKQLAALRRDPALASAGRSTYSGLAEPPGLGAPSGRSSHPDASAPLVTGVLHSHSHPSASLAPVASTSAGETGGIDPAACLASNSGFTHSNAAEATPGRDSVNNPNTSSGPRISGDPSLPRAAATATVAQSSPAATHLQKSRAPSAAARHSSGAQKIFEIEVSSSSAGPAERLSYQGGQEGGADKPPSEDLGSQHAMGLSRWRPLGEVVASVSSSDSGVDNPLSTPAKKPRYAHSRIPRRCCGWHVSISRPCECLTLQWATSRLTKFAM